VIERLKRARIRAVPTGLAHGTITAVLHDGPVEVTTLRRDVAPMAATPPSPIRRNGRKMPAAAISQSTPFFADPESGEVFDYFGGARRSGGAAGPVHRSIPLKRIAEDHLASSASSASTPASAPASPMLRRSKPARCEPTTSWPCRERRIADELLKLLALPEPIKTIALMVERGILRPVLPEIDGNGLRRLSR
jgi:poly(A) polymerase